MDNEHHGIIYYLEHDFRTFDEHPFTEVDSLLLSKLAYFHWADVPEISEKLQRVMPPRLADLYRAEYFESIFSTAMDNEKDRELFAAVAASPRFRDVCITKHTDNLDEEAEKQFSATTFLLPDKTAYVAFRGTDASLVGWKEDFQLAFITPVPSQQAAREYFDQLVSQLPFSKIRVGGHSKGGNLAVYAAAMCKPKVRERILKVYSHDGPGFNEQALTSQEFAAVTPLLSKSVPESSVIGMLLEHQETYHVVKSDGVGIMQHDPYSWLVDEDGAFIPAEKLDASADYLNSTLSTWVGGMSPQQMETFTNALFGIFGASGAKTFQEMTVSDYRASAAALVNMDPDMRKVLLQTLTELASISVRGLIPNREG